MKYIIENLLVDILSVFPTYLGIILRNLYWRGKLRMLGKHIYLGMGIAIRGSENIEVGDDITIMPRSYLYAKGGHLRIGNRVSINTNVQINASDGGDITIGNDVLIASNVVIRASNHSYKRLDIPIREQGYDSGKIIIEDGAWIGSNAVILPDVTIGKGAIVGAGAVVSNNIAQYLIAGGIPAKIIGDRKRGRNKQQ